MKKKYTIKIILIIFRGISKVYTFNPVFRAENSRSRLHLSEFYMIEAEEAFVKDINVILERMENCIKCNISSLLDKNLKEIEYLIKENETDVKDQMKMLENVLNKSFTIMTFIEAKEIVNKNRDKISHVSGKSNNFTKEEELFLVKNNNNIPIFVIDWPKENMAFYMKEKNDLVSTRKNFKINFLFSSNVN